MCSILHVSACTCVFAAPRLCIASILAADVTAGFLVTLACVCASWVPVSHGSTGRSWMNPMGFWKYRNVSKCNCMVSRALLLCALVLALGGVYVLEQPRQSIVRLHKRFRQFVEKMCGFEAPVFRQSFWMAHYGSRSWKPTRTWSCAKWIAKLDKGPLSKFLKKTANMPTTTQYRDSKNQKKFKGNKNLKLTQLLGWKFTPHMHAWHKSASMEHAWLINQRTLECQCFLDPLKPWFIRTHVAT